MGVGGLSGHTASPITYSQLTVWQHWPVYHSGGVDRLVISLIPWKAWKCQTEELLISPREKGKKIKRQSCGGNIAGKKRGGACVLSEHFYREDRLITVLSVQQASSNTSGNLRELADPQGNRNTRRIALICLLMSENYHFWQQIHSQTSLPSEPCPDEGEEGPVLI